jgi:hypothetical protein
MSPILRAVALPVGLGLAAMILTFVVMMSAAPLPTAVLTAVIYWRAGFLASSLMIRRFWFTPLLMVAPVWIIFIPMGMEIWPPVIQIWYFLVPPGVALIFAWVGLFVGPRRRSHEETTRTLTR